MQPAALSNLVDAAETTAGALTLASCRAAGLTDRQLEWLTGSRRWQMPFPRVFVLFSGPIPPLTLHHAALLYAGDDAALSHDSSGWLWRLRRAPLNIHVTVPYNREVADQPGLVIHRSRTLHETDIHPALLPRRTRIERTVLDLLATCRNADEAIGLVADAIAQRATIATRIREALLARTRTRWRKVLLEVLPDIGAGAHSALEVRDARMRRRHGLPMGTRQLKRRRGGAEYLDVLIKEYRVHVELDGRIGHDKTREEWRDMRRDNASERLQLRHLRYGWADMIDRPCEVAIEQAVILRQQGWRGPFLRCRDCPTPLPPGL